MDTRAILALVVLSLVCVVFSFVWPQTRSLETLEDWRQRQESQMQQLYEDIQARVTDLEKVTRRLGDEAYALAADSSRTVPTGEERVALLESVGKLQRAVDQELSSGLQGGIAVQVFAADGRLLAWAGPALLETTTRRITRYQRGERQIYFRQGGVHTFLTYDRQDGRGVDGADVSTPHPRVVVDLPVQVASRLPQSTLQSWSLSEEFSRSELEVELHFDARNLPSYLVTQDIEFSGDEQRGLQAEFAVRGEDGSPRFAGRITESPYADHVQLHRRALRRMQLRLWAVAFLFLATAGVFAVRRLPARVRRWGTPLTVLLVVWVLRFLLVALDIPASRVGGPSLLDPQGFGMTQLGGALRTPADLLLTALACLASAVVCFWLVLRDVRRIPRHPSAAAGLVSGLVAAAVVAAAILASIRLIGVFASNTTASLMGTTLDPGSLVALVVQSSILATVAAILVVAMVVAAWLSTQRSLQLLAGVALLSGFGMGFSWTMGIVAAFVWLGGNWLRTLLRDQRFTSFGLAVFALVAVVATLSADALHHQAFRERQASVVDSADTVRQMVDEVRRFVLERMLEDLRNDPSVFTGSPRQRDVERNSLAFRLWAGSILSHLGWSSQVRVYDAFGVLASEYAVDMPYARDTPSRELLDRVRAEGLRVEQSEVESTTAGRVRVYRGAVPIALGGRVQALVVVDLPFAREDLAQNTSRPGAPRGLLPSENAGDARQQRLFAWVEDGVVVESSTPFLAVGTTLERPAEAGEWQDLHLVNGDYRVTQRGSGPRVLWVGFRTPGAFDRLLEWSQVASLYFGQALAALLILVGVARIPAVQRRLPLLLVPKRIGFQQKLMGAFLVVALLPSLVLSWATRDVTRDRNVERNRDVALEKARSAEAALADLVRREIDTVRESEYLREVLNEEDTPPVRDIGHLEFSQIMVFQGDGQLVLDETLSNLSDEQARDFVTGAPGRVFASRDGSGNLNLGALVPVWYSRETGLNEAAEDASLYYLYYRRRLTDGVLRDLAPILNTDISGFLGPELVVSSQMGLATAGLLPSLVAPDAFQQIQLRRNRYAVIEERVGDQVFFTGYLPLRDRFDQRIGSLAVSQFLQQDAFAAESERTRAVVVGLSTLMFVLTLILGVVFASRIFDPVRNLIEGTQRLAGGEFGFRLRARAGDEIGQLERSFNDMAQSLQSAQQTLEERRRYLEAVLGNVASGVVATDSNGRITATNQAVERILHRRGSSLEGRSCQELAAAAPDSGARTLWTRIGSGRDGEEFEVTLLRDGERLTLRVIATDLRPADTAAPSLGRVAIFEDVTELIRSKKLSAWAEMARQVAHEIKNPLTPLKSEAQFMERAWRDRSDKFPQIFEEGMKTIIQQVDALRGIASEFSNYGRVQKLAPRPLDLGVLLEGVVGPYTNMKGLQVDVQGANGSFPGSGVQVLADEEGLRKVFRNILENARESMQGQGRIELRVEPPDNGTVQVVITDEGHGISNDAQERLFEPYFSTKSTGTGLGLAITRGILEELGGRITLANRPQGGAEARVTLVVC